MAKEEKIFKITNAGGKRDSADIKGLEIVETDDGFELVQPHVVLAKSTPGPAGVLARFKLENFKGFKWAVDIERASASTMSGKWTNDDPDPEKESDVWVASGTGTTPDDEARDDDARAAYGK